MKKKKKNEQSSSLESSDVEVEAQVPEIEKIAFSTNLNHSPSNIPQLDFVTGYTADEKHNVPFPASFFIEPRIYMAPAVYKSVLDHASETTSVEICGVLVGEVMKDANGNYLNISGFIRGEHAKNSGCQVSFTHETWDYINSEMENKYKDRSIIGWYHTHPGFGIFLSEMDKFIHDNFFNMPYQIAMVIDPIADKQGIFLWIEGKIRAISKFWSGDKIIELTKGSVGEKGSDSNFEEEDFAYSNSYVNQNGEGSNPREEKITYLTFVRPFVFMVLAFLIGFFLNHQMFSNQIVAAAVAASRAEVQELLVSYSYAFMLKNEIQDINNQLNLLIPSDGSLSPSREEIIIKLKPISESLNSLVSESAARSDMIATVLKSMSERVITKQYNNEQIMVALKSALGQSLYLQLQPFLKALDAQPLEADRYKEIKQLLDYICLLEPRLRQSIQLEFPWLFNL